LRSSLWAALALGSLSGKMRRISRPISRNSRARRRAGPPPSAMFFLRAQKRERPDRSPDQAFFGVATSPPRHKRYRNLRTRSSFGGFLRLPARELDAHL